MKKKLNILCIIALIFIAIPIAYSVFNSGTVLVNLFQAGKEDAQRAGKSAVDMLQAKKRSEAIDNLHSVSFRPNLSFSDSVTNAKTGKRIPAIITEAAVSVKAGNNAVKLTDEIISVVLLVICIYIIFQFIKFIIDINHDIIFDRRSVRRLRKIGFSCLIMALLSCAVTIMDVYPVTEVFGLKGSDLLLIDWTSFSDDFIDGLLCLIFAEIFAIGLKLKEEQELTI
jgi:hypothetical protein